MESLTELYRVGMGPSSSHTMAPRRAAERFGERNGNASAFRVTLYGSLAATGVGHLTDAAIRAALAPRPVEIIWRPEETLPLHPNGMRFEAIDASEDLVDRWEVYSPGGGALLEEGKIVETISVYPDESLAAILERCERSGESLWEYVEACEGNRIWDALANVWRAMQQAIERGLATEGRLPGGIGVSRKARSLARKATLFDEPLERRGLLAAFAFAVAEENAAGGIVVTAPTCGSSGVVPAVLRSMDAMIECTQADLLHALATAGLIGNLVKHNASISGAEIGCQGEIGTACAMAAAAATQLYGGTIHQIEYAAEMGIEHHLGLTCDPVAGLVQIPCIERNASAAMRALDAAQFSLLLDGTHLISFDDVVAVMNETGHALPSLYRETSEGGLARAYERRQADRG
ncbi:L-serine ammonia-lyase, iron-sulfur-dependent, subunit alpha [Candidatus Bipolaricaulota bacterium]|nr:L-serine ammonia-lyase, iron-sulfur-dependent, subunit alpha [Candidatus Bipolaricaulota bacterium]